MHACNRVIWVTRCIAAVLAVTHSRPLWNNAAARFTQRPAALTSNTSLLQSPLCSMSQFSTSPDGGSAAGSAAGRYSPSLWPSLPRPHSLCQSVQQEPPPSVFSASRWPPPSEGGSSAAGPELIHRERPAHTHITLMLFGRSTIDQLVTKKNAWHSHRCFWGLSLSAVIFQLLDWGEASHWDLAAQHTDQLLLMTKLMLLYCGKRKTRLSWVG